MGSTWIQRGCFRPVANALTLSPGAATGICPSLHPLAVGILSVGRLPCGFAAGTTGALPQAGSGAAPCSRRHSMRGGADQRDDSRKNAGHVIPLLIARTLSDASAR